MINFLRAHPYSTGGFILVTIFLYKYFRFVVCEKSALIMCGWQPRVSTFQLQRASNSHIQNRETLSTQHVGFSVMRDFTSASQMYCIPFLCENNRSILEHHGFLQFIFSDLRTIFPQASGLLLFLLQWFVMVLDQCIVHLSDVIIKSQFLF